MDVTVARNVTVLVTQSMVNECTCMYNFTSYHAVVTVEIQLHLSIVTECLSGLEWWLFLRRIDYLSQKARV